MTRADERPAAMGCMRLSTEGARDEARGVQTLHAALDAGITLLDTADAYCLDAAERGHNERLIARALASWTGDRSRVRVATKGGLVRPQGRWEPDGRARHLAAACEESCRALGVDRLDLYQLHAPDPRVPLATSVRALAALRREGLVQAIGLCNVTVGQIAEARRITDIASVQVELSLWQDHALLSGVAEYCTTHGVTLLAYRPLGGPRARAALLADPVLGAVAAEHGVTPFEIALAWLRGLSEVIVPLPGATRPETARSSAAAARLVLTQADRARLDERTPSGRTWRTRALSPSVSVAPGAEVVLVMGLPAAGKSSVAGQFAARGYQRLNRDLAGGTLDGLLPALDRALASDVPRVVLDNTYMSRASRAPVIRAAATRGVPVRCVWLDTPLEQAQVNAAWRIVTRYGRLPDEPELARLRRTDVSAFLPGVLFRHQRALEPPDAAEGFTRIDVEPFARTPDPACVNRALIVWCDDVLLASRSGRGRPVDADDVAVPDAAAHMVRQYAGTGWRVLGLSWQPAIGDGTTGAADVEAVFARMRDLLGLQIPVDYCPHPAGPPRCWCRKPLPGLGALLVWRYQLDPAQCVYVGDGPQDPGFARRLGFRHLSPVSALAHVMEPE